MRIWPGRRGGFLVAGWWGSGGGKQFAPSGKMAVAGRGAAAVKPIFSRDLAEAKRRVRELYRAWYREVPNAGEGSAPAACAQEGPRAQGRNGRPAALGG